MCSSGEHFFNWKLKYRSVCCAIYECNLNNILVLYLAICGLVWTWTLTSLSKLFLASHFSIIFRRQTKSKDEQIQLSPAHMLEWSVVGDGGRRDAVSSMDVYGGGQSGDISDGDDSEIAAMSPSLWCPLLRLCQPASRHPISPPPSWEQADTSQWRQRGSRTSASKSSIRSFVITEKAPTRAFSWLKAVTTYRFHI